MLQSPAFWAPFLVSFLVTGTLFAWELGFLHGYIRSLPRIPATQIDILFTVILGLLLSLSIGLMGWNMKNGSCPAGVKNASGVAGVLGAVTLLCPVCLVLPGSLLGVGFLFSVLTPFLPILRMIAILLLAVSIWMLRPAK